LHRPFSASLAVCPAVAMVTQSHAHQNEHLLTVKFS